jgi:hypothetical protein
MHSVRVAGVILISAMMAILAGCGPSTGVVSGTITLNGQTPNRKGLQITFMAVNGQTTGAIVGEDGTYSASGVLAGENGVGLVYVPSLVSDGKTPGRRPDNAPAAVVEPASANPIAKTLRHASTSGLKLTVEPSKRNVFNYDVAPAPPG